jgi:hypothetical protein
MRGGIKAHEFKHKHNALLPLTCLNRHARRACCMHTADLARVPTQACHAAAAAVSLLPCTLP